MSDAKNEQAPQIAASTETSAHEPTHAVEGTKPTSAATPAPSPAHAEGETKDAPKEKARPKGKDGSDLYKVEEWAERKKTDPATLAGARARHGWAKGRQLTEKEYDDAIAQIGKVELR